MIFAHKEEVAIFFYVNTKHQRGVVVNVLDYDIVVSEFEFQ